MKKIINGKKYDTDTATRVGHFHNGFFNSDFHYLEEDLYQKKTGEFFLCGEGGALTKYRCQVDGNMWGYGSEIIPLSIDEAKAWVEEHMSGNDYEDIFGEVDE